MTDAIAIVTGNHFAQGDTAVIEGNGILTGLLDHPQLRGFVASGALRMVELAPASESELLHATVARGTGQHLDPDASGTRRIPAMDWRFSRWLVAEAEPRRVPAVSTQPRETLAARILAT